MAQLEEKKWKQQQWPGYVEEGHPEKFDVRAMNANASYGLKPGQLTRKEIQQFFEKGFVVVEKFFTRQELEPCLDACMQLVDDLASKLHEAGKIKELYKDYDVFERLIKLNDEFPGAAVLLHKLGHMPKAFCDLWSNERLLNVIEQLIGPDIAGHPNWNLRTKTPKNEELTVPWHQDAAYMHTSCYQTLVPTVWIPFLDTDTTNGCMEVIPEGHKSGRVGVHTCCSGGTWYIEISEEEIKRSLDCCVSDRQSCPIPFGGFLLFNNIIPHRSLENFSSKTRWSIDLRYKRPRESNGMFGLKNDIILRSSSNLNLVIDWDNFNSIDRTKAQIAYAKQKAETEDEFDLTIQGPWMAQWEITHMNAHAQKHKYMQRLKEQQKECQQKDSHSH